MTTRKMPLAMTALPDELVVTWRTIWVNRERPYALQQKNGTYRWLHDALTRELLAAHLAGEVTLALSSADAEGSAKWACLDIDQKVAPSRLLRLRDAFGEHGLHATLEASRRGGHLWFLLEHAVPVATLRWALLRVMRDLEQEGVDLPACELYPDICTKGSLGHAVRYPLGIHLLTSTRYPLFDPDGLPRAFTSIETALHALLELPRIPVQVVEALSVEDNEEDDASEDSVDSLDTETPPATNTSTRSSMIRWVDAHVSPLDLLAEYVPQTKMRRSGQGYLGWCPFHDDKAPDEHSEPGSPSFYVVHNTRHGWSWRCLSTNCRHHEGPMRHSFRLFQDLNGLDAAGALVVATLRWPEADA